MNKYPTPAPTLLPLAAMMLAGSMGATPAWAQATAEKTLQTVTVHDNSESPTAAKDKLLVRNTGIAKGSRHSRTSRRRSP